MTSGLALLLSFTIAWLHEGASPGQDKDVFAPHCEPRPEVVRVMGTHAQFSTLTLAGQQYLSQLAAIGENSRQSQSAPQRDKNIRNFLGEQTRNIGPFVFISRHRLARPNAAGCMISQSEPTRWGCSIRICDPAASENGVQTVFEDPDGSIFDMSLSYDAKTVFFSFRRKEDRCWQIYKTGIDGHGLDRISRNCEFSETSPVELPDGRLLFISTRSGGYIVSESGPRSNLHVMERNGTDVRCISQNTLSDMSPYVLPDGRVLFTRWEYVDRDAEYRQGLWTQSPAGRQFQLFFGNTIREVGIFWQAKPVPGHENLLVATFGPAVGRPEGAIGLVNSRHGMETARGQGFAWITADDPTVGETAIHTDGMSYSDIDDGRLLNLAISESMTADAQQSTDMSLSHELVANTSSLFDSIRSAHRDPYPLNDYQFLVSYSGSDVDRFAIYLLDLCGNRSFVVGDPNMSCLNPLPLRSRTVPFCIGNLHRDDEGNGSWGTLMIANVYDGLSGVSDGQAKYIQVMEQVPKTHEGSHRAYDQSPIIGYGTYYVKRCWGRVPIEPDGSAHFTAPAFRELYLQILDAEGRELQRQTSSIQLAHNEVRSCIGCHEPRNSTPAVSTFPIAACRPPTHLMFPAWTENGLIDFGSTVSPILDKYCVQCHSGPNPAGGCNLSTDKTRFFNMAYDNLLGRSHSYRQHNLNTGRMLSQEAAKGKPLVHFFWLKRSPTGHNRSLWSGSGASRIQNYLDKEHCGKSIPSRDRQRIYMWIDANVPFYATYSASRPLSPGSRDLCADIDTGKSSRWYTEQFLEVYERRCESCHGTYPHPNDHNNIWDGRFAWINFSHPDWSPALMAHLSKNAGGRGLATRRFTTGPSLFENKDDSDYQEMLSAIQQGHRQMLDLPRVDMTSRGLGLRPDQ